MNNTETTRQQKLSRQIQKDISDIFIREAAGLLRGSMVSVTTVRISPDLSYAKIYLSIFPFARHAEVMKTLESNNWMIRKALGTRLRNQVKSIPELSFFLDDSLEYIDNIDTILRENPLKEPAEGEEQAEEVAEEVAEEAAEE